MTRLVSDYRDTDNRSSGSMLELRDAEIAAVRRHNEDLKKILALMEKRLKCREWMLEEDATTIRSLEAEIKAMRESDGKS